jgi:RNA polymerase sigma factor (sigma-70 family)
VLVAVASRVTFSSVSIIRPDGTANTLLQYRTTVSTDDRGRFATVVPPGTYDVTVEPAEETGFASSRTQLTDALEALDRLSREAISLESSVAGTEKRLEDFVADALALQPDGGIDDDRMRMGVGSLIGNLTDREQLILRLRYGLGGEEEHTLEQIGQSLGLSRERVRQLEARALRKLRDTLPAQRLYPILEP